MRAKGRGLVIASRIGLDESQDAGRIRIGHACAHLVDRRIASGRDEPAPKIALLLERKRLERGRPPTIGRATPARRDGREGGPAKKRRLPVETRHSGKCGRSSDCRRQARDTQVCRSSRRCPQQLANLGRTAFGQARDIALQIVGRSRRWRSENRSHRKASGKANLLHGAGFPVHPEGHQRSLHQLWTIPRRQSASAMR